MLKRFSIVVPKIVKMFWIDRIGGEKLWALKTVALILSFDFGFWILLGIVFGDFGDSGASALAEDMTGTLVVLLLLRAAKRTCLMTLSEMAITSWWPWKNVLLGLLLGAGLWLSAGAISVLLRPVLPDWAILPEEYNFTAQFAKSHGAERIILFFVFGFTTPFIEEVLFRGLIYSILRRAFSVLGTMIISSALFGLGHIYLEVGLISFFIGCGLAWLREQCKSLDGPIIAHMTVNCLSLTFFSGDFNV